MLSLLAIVVINYSIFGGHTIHCFTDVHLRLGTLEPRIKRWFLRCVGSGWESKVIYYCDLVVDLPLWKIWVRQLGLLFPIYGKIKNVHNHQPVIGQHLKYGDLGGSVLSWGYPQIIYHGWPWRLVLKFMVTWGSPIFRNLQLCWNNNGGSIWRLKEASRKKTPKLHEFPGKQGLTLSKFFASTVMEPKRSIEPLIILLLFCWNNPWRMVPTPYRRKGYGKLGTSSQFNEQS